MSTVVIYGIKNCSTIKKACTWLADHDIEFTLHDYRRDGLDETLLQTLLNQFGWEALVNQRGMIWRQLDDVTKTALDANTAATLMLAKPAIIKRPALHAGKTWHLGFAEPDYAKIFQS